MRIPHLSASPRTVCVLFDNQNPYDNVYCADFSSLPVPLSGGGQVVPLLSACPCLSVFSGLQQQLSLGTFYEAWFQELADNLIVRDAARIEMWIKFADLGAPISSCRLNSFQRAVGM